MCKQYLTRKEAAEYLKEQGLPVSPNTLQKYATVGGGPEYKIFGNKAVYTESDLDQWAENKLLPPHSIANSNCKMSGNETIS
ncbi:MAG: helix-turn-helix domain-containing protein [Candidatus Thiodiazotropha sp. (ex Clathrolucina costata)]|nr:helix-turn-helix domain-containing protein [Candidatus Thiodiazotropha taylori]